jgi:PAS domain S-box-containing protein
MDTTSETEAVYRTVFESSSEGLGILDQNGILVDANSAFSRMFGVPPEELIGTPMKITDPEVVEALATRGFYQRQVVNERNDGSLAHQDVRLSHVTYRGLPHYLCVLRNLGEEVEAYQFLEHRVEARTRELATLLEVSRNISSGLGLKHVLDLILDALHTVVPYDGAAILSIDGDQVEYLVRRAPTPVRGGDRYQFRPAYMNILLEIINRGEPVIIDDVREDTRLAEAYRLHAPELMETRLGYVRSWMAVPMIVRGEVISMLILASSQPGYYEPEHADLAMAFGQQAGIAIEHARLYEQAQRTVALEERQRLARELHDSVSQVLYGIGLAAQTARALIEHDPTGAIRPLDYIASLAQTGMAEMRALIFELRPESLETEGLIAALQKQAAALSARHGVPIPAMLGDEPGIPLADKEGLYRIAQEAMHNAFKHARPSRVELSLGRVEDELVLKVSDDGQGFDPEESFPGHLGLHSMRERTAKLSARLDIQSTPGKGTAVRVAIPLTRDLEAVSSRGKYT